MNLKAMFTDHPAMVGETYPEHMRTALSFAGPLARATLGALVHAFLPFLCTTTASDTVKGLYARMTKRCATCKAGPVHRPDLFPGRVSASTRVPDTLLAWDPVI
ncbi:DUF6356 family protein [uncultured Enterovirga sp.]|uniref:DUF6356 family protein n=1 Tax=uncultured Enterovirga sp. TaxID=2026352 RepID=UPI0035C984C7